ncbi:glycosyltransferase [Flavihumibacter rivuli]|uniref:glycosyltransferase n=1 Tax=Flavihumibacter rivuli TaxID=2838156 RepID=UPI001BDE8E15|nr:glycosyltransferase [Flavihumibacter rivuli]ULQ57950.1 glycosyltransferase [Flavihumibacter rivuli]
MQKKLFYVGYSGFPYGLAQVERQKLIAKGMDREKCAVTVLCRDAIHDPSVHQLEAVGEFEGIPYRYCSGTPYRSNGFLKRNLTKIKALFNEAVFIVRSARRKQVDALLVTTNKVSNVFFYSLLGKLTGLPVVIDTVEFNSSIKINRKWWIRKDESLYDKYSVKLADKVIVISDFLYDWVRKVSPEKPLMKIPAIVDFGQFAIPRHDVSPYFLFCGSTNYFEVIQFVLDAFDRMDIDGADLCLVCSGNPKALEHLREVIGKSRKKDQIRLYSGLPYRDLVQLYKDSYALLIPLRNSFQDKARFPHKIGEYCAAGRAIISTNYGEVARYFKDRENAILADDFDVLGFAGCLEYAISHQEEVERIGAASHELGMQTFDHKVLAEQVRQFIFS